MRNFFSKKLNKAENNDVEKLLSNEALHPGVVQMNEERTELEKSELLQKQLNNLYLVNEVSRNITSSLSVEESFLQMYQTINSMMDASVIELVVIDEENNRSFYSNKKYTASELSLTDYNHLSEWSYKNSKEVFLEDAENDFGRYVSMPLVIPNETTAKSLMCFPVMHLNKITGTLCIISFMKNAFENFHRDIIRLLLPFVGVSIDNAFKHNQLNNLKQRAERSEHFMQVFLANMSHEIRTPMNAVMGMTNLLLQKNPKPEQLKYLSTIQKSSENLLVILNDILDLSKIEAGKIEFEKIDFSVRNVIQNVQEILQFKAEEKGLAFLVQTSKKVPEVLVGDPIRLTQILLNLIGNALKFTESGQVKLITELLLPETMPDSTEAIAHHSFIIEDTGIGMSSVQQKTIFSTYTQASSSINRKYGGTGLGLSISKQLIELQGGTIEIESEQGKGSKFIVKLSYPISENQLVRSRENSITQSMLESMNGLRILLADDNEYNRIVIRETLELKIKNSTIIEANDGQQALKLLRDTEFDLVMMDLVMPTLNGIDAAIKIRNEFPESKKNIPIIAITASVQKKEIERCFEIGMNGFIPKPFKTNFMLASIYEVLQHSQAASAKISNKVQNNTWIDWNHIQQISEGDHERIKRYRELFLEHAPQALADLGQALENNNSEKAIIAAHNLKPMLNFNGILRAYQLAELIEHACAAEVDFEKLAVSYKELSQICHQAFDELTKD